jgi:hypothetical protein
MQWHLRRVDVSYSCKNVLSIRRFVKAVFPTYIESAGRYNSVGIASLYGLDGPGIESLWRRDFPQPSRPALGPTQPPLQWVPLLFPRCKAAEAWRWPLTTSSADVKERVELYFCSPFGPSWPVLEWTLRSTYTDTCFCQSKYTLLHLDWHRNPVYWPGFREGYCVFDARIPTGARHFSLPHSVQPGCESHSISHSVGSRWSYSRG